MSKRKKYAAGHYYRNDLLLSPAWREMANLKYGGGGPAIYIFNIFTLKLENFEKVQSSKPGKRSFTHAMYQAANHRELQFTYREAEKFGYCATKFDRAIETLVKFGFIDIIKTGMGLHKEVTIYGISHRWEKWGTPEFEKVERKKSTQFKAGFKRCNTEWKKNNCR